VSLCISALREMPFFPVPGRKKFPAIDRFHAGDITTAKGQYCFEDTVGNKLTAANTSAADFICNPDFAVYQIRPAGLPLLAKRV